jgi:DNA-binding MarR family transcriptional regulator
MEIFLMAAVSRGGLDTLYSLQRTVGLEPGSLSQVIKRLVAAGLMVRAEGAKRGRRVMALTDAGQRFLSEGWKTSLDPKREVESIIRSTIVALLMGDVSSAMDFLFQSASERRRHSTAPVLRTGHSKMSVIDLHGKLRAVYESRRAEMEAGVLEEFGIYLADWEKNRRE